MTAELDRLREQHARLQERLAQSPEPALSIEAMQEQLATLEASVSSPSGNVTIVAGPGGSIRDVVLSDGAMRQPAVQLATEIKTALAQAVATAARKQARIVDEHTGGTLGSYERVMQNQAEALGTTVDEIAAKADEAAAQKKAVKPPRDDDDFSQNMVLAKDHKKRATPQAPTEPATSSAGDEFLQNLFDKDMT